QYHLPFVLRLQGSLDNAGLEFALRSIVARHEILRTVIRKDGDEVHQVVMEPGSLVLSKMQDDSSSVESLIGGLLALPFDLSEDLMIRATVIEKTGADHLLVLVIHHIAADGWSIPILLGELTEFYASFIEGREANVGALSLQYSDYSLWQRDYLSGAELSNKLGYWKNALQGLSPLVLPTDYSRSDIKSNRGSMAHHAFGLELTRKLSSYSTQEGTTLFMTLLAGFKVLLYRYSGQEDICVGTPIANRTQTELESLVGFFVNSLALRSELSGDLSFADFLQDVKSMTLGAYDHQDVPFEKVVEVVAKDRDMGRSPVFQVMFGLQNADPQGTAQELPNLSLSLYPFEHTTSQFEMNFSLHESPSGLWGSLEYRTDLFTADTIARFLKHYELLLEAIVANPDLSLDTYTFVDSQEQELLLTNGTVEGPSFEPFTNLVGLFEEQVRFKADAIALVAGSNSLTYEELNVRSNQLAHYLLRKGVVKGEPISLLLDRGIDLMVSILGILKAGGAYLPLDVDYPKERIGYMLDDARSRYVVTSTSIGSSFLEAPYSLVYIDSLQEEIALEPQNNPSLDRTFDDLAYVMYTSGSTGLPKGVLVEDGNVVSLVKGVSYLSFSSTTTMLSTGSPSFDASTLEYWGTLLNGGTLVVCSKNELLDNRILGKTIVDNGVNTMWFTSGFLNQLVDEDLGLFGDLERVIVGGEKLSEKHIDLLKEAYPGLRIINGYGPTENTTFSLTYELNESDQKGIIPIGKALENRSVFILDKHHSLCPIGVVGEICVGGLGLSRGYLNNEALTSSRFIDHPFLKGHRLYKTGDWGRLRADGNVEYHGRKDDQVKIRGHRLEPGEIEQHLLGYPAIRNAVVGVKESLTNGVSAKRLVAYLQVEPTFSVDELQTYLSTKLPDYMIPSVFHELEDFPLTSNGKIDKASLLSMELEGQELLEQVSPRNEQEQILAEIWQELLGLDSVGIRDDFFELGGHSLLAIRLVSSIRKRLELEITIGDLFEYTTIESLSDHLKVYSPPSGLTPILGQKRPDRIPLSFSQERLWFIDQLEGSVQYHVPAVLRLKGELNIEALSYAIGNIIKRHEVLRSVIREDGGTPYQEILDAGGWSLSILENEDYATNKYLLDQTIEELLTTPFDLATDYMLRASVIKLHEHEHVLIVVLHHIASDGWSIPIIVSELTVLYNTEVKQIPYKLNELKIQYADYSIWQRTPEQEEKMEQKLAYWENQLKDTSTLQLHTNYPRPPIQTTNGLSEGFLMDKELSEAVQQFCKEKGVTLFMTLLTAFKVLLYRYSGQEDICVGTPIANRGQHEIEDLIGFFVNTLALRTKIAGED
ncbi:MAG: amino acid adenylation domain-containing protein, partial [Bacteroidetes bacterium]|nr:amino acid adenylation domain-containing protein [Bacteroidota bacterium]